MVETIDRVIPEDFLLSDDEIAERKQLFGLTGHEATLLAGCGVLIEKDIDEILDSFFAEAGRGPVFQTLVPDDGTLSRLRHSFRRYISELFGGDYGPAYVSKRMIIGRVHERVGVKPTLYLSGVRLLQSILDRSIRRNARDGEAADLAARREEALHKILLFDTQLVFDTYIASLTSEVEAAKHALEEYATALEKKVAERTRQLDELARTDSLTGLLNRRAFEEHLDRELAVARRHRSPLTLVFLDLNGFKILNDEKGHKAGDAVLATLGSCLRQFVRQGDFPCRYGGDEFCIVMPRSTLEEATAAWMRLSGKFDKHQSEGITLSVGMAQAGPEKFADSGDLVGLADQMMYAAKAASREEPGTHLRATKVAAP